MELCLIRKTVFSPPLNAIIKKRNRVNFFVVVFLIVCMKYIDLSKKVSRKGRKVKRK